VQYLSTECCFPCKAALLAAADRVCRVRVQERRLPSWDAGWSRGCAYGGSERRIGPPLCLSVPPASPPPEGFLLLEGIGDGLRDGGRDLDPPLGLVVEDLQLEGLELVYALLSLAIIVNDG
jgi:hypothetical protein